MRYSTYILPLIALFSSIDAAPQANTANVDASQGSINSSAQPVASQSSQASAKAGSNYMQNYATPYSNQQATQYQANPGSAKPGASGNYQNADIQAYEKKWKSLLKTMITSPDTKVNLYSLAYDPNNVNIDQFVTADAINQLTTTFKLQQFTPAEIDTIIAFYNQLKSKNGMFSLFDILNQGITFFGTNDSITQKIATDLLQFTLSNPYANAQFSQMVSKLISTIGNDNLMIIAQDMQKFMQQFPSQAKLLQEIDSKYRLNGSNYGKPYGTNTGKPNN